jgi:hypothetical protein
LAGAFHNVTGGGLVTSLCQDWAPWAEASDAAKSCHSWRGWRWLSWCSRHPVGGPLACAAPLYPHDHLVFLPCSLCLDPNAIHPDRYTRWAASQGYRVATAERTAGEEAGVKSVELMVEGRFAYGYLKGGRVIYRCWWSCVEADLLGGRVGARETGGLRGMRCLFLQRCAGGWHLQAGICCALSWAQCVLNSQGWSILK